jgi:hypothetical protein
MCCLVVCVYCMPHASVRLVGLDRTCILQIGDDGLTGYYEWFMMMVTLCVQLAVAVVSGQHCCMCCLVVVFGHCMLRLVGFGRN